MSVVNLIDIFTQQAEACEALGSAFTGNLCRLFAANLTGETAVGRLCLNWPGNPESSADNVPLRLCGGFHAIVLSGRDEKLAGLYPPHIDTPLLWSEAFRVLKTHEAFLLKWMESPPQTNEVSRSAILWPAFMEVARLTELPLRLLEVGASGGLNLQAHRFGYNLSGQAYGDGASTLQLKPEWRGDEPNSHPVEIASQEGCDLNPLDPTDQADILRLRSYVWPDQIERKQRMDAALNIAQEHPIRVEKADAVEWLSRKLAAPVKGVCTLVFSTVAWQYLPIEARDAGEAVILAAARKTNGEKSPLAWLRFEADGKAPGGGVSLQLWPQNINKSLGRADFHGRWIDWNR